MPDFVLATVALTVVVCNAPALLKAGIALTQPRSL